MRDGRLSCCAGLWRRLKLNLGIACAPRYRGVSLHHHISAGAEEPPAPAPPGRCCRWAGTSGPVVAAAAQHPRLQRRILKASALAEAAARSRLEHLMNHGLGGTTTHQTHAGADLIRSLIICPIFHERTFKFLSEIRLKFCITDFGVTLGYFSRRASASDSSSSLRRRI